MNTKVVKQIVSAYEKALQEAKNPRIRAWIASEIESYREVYLK